jgi:ParB family transcriptional regulator, chromosome partitioning protein
MNKVLGRGLGSLIPKKTLKVDDQGEITIVKDDDRILHISPTLIQANPYQPRSNFLQKALEDLKNSIIEHGIMQPLVATKSDNGFQLIAGERRLRAALDLNLETVPVIVRKADNQKKLELALIENLQREDLNPLENALAFKKLIEEFSLTQDEVAKKVGKARSTLTNSLRLLNLSTEMQNALASERISEAHAKYLLSIEDEVQRNNVFKKIIRHNLSVKDTSLEIKSLSTKLKKRTLKDDLDLDLTKVLESKLGTKVLIKRTPRGGKIEIDFYSNEDLENIIKKIKKLK